MYIYIYIYQSTFIKKKLLKIATHPKNSKFGSGWFGSSISNPSSDAGRRSGSLCGFEVAA